MQNRRRADVPIAELRDRVTLTVREASRLTGLSLTAIEELVAQRKIDFSRASPHRTLVYRESLQAFIDASKTRAIP
jgi:excisionase family DNA binding protein